ncbi:MAG: DUF998 domain-containing protein [Arenimonas sp.]
MRKIAFWSAISSYVLFLATLVIGAKNYPGYLHTSQFISELGASGAPTEMFFRVGNFLPCGILIMVFSFAAIKVLPKSGVTTLGFCLLAYNAFGSLTAAFFPCDFGCRPESPSVSQIIHNLVGLGGYLAAVAGLFVLAIQARTWSGMQYLFQLGIGCGSMAFASLLLFDPGFEFTGLAQRSLEFSVGLWILSCAWSLRKFEDVHS